MSSSTLSNQFITREGEAGEAPAEPLRRQLGRSLALPLFFKRLTWQRCLQGWPRSPIGTLWLVVFTLLLA